MTRLEQLSDAELVERCCAGAVRFGERIVEVPGAEVLNDVGLNPQAREKFRRSFVQGSDRLG
jgi:hypothetical protein